MALPSKLAAVAAVVATVALAACSGPAPQPTTTPQTSRTTASPTVPATRPAGELRAYAFQPGQLPVNAGNEQAALRFEATVGIPAGTGPFPVAVLVHGSYTQCIHAAKDVQLPGANTMRWPVLCKGKPVGPTHGLTQGNDYVRHAASLGYLAKALADRGIMTVSFDLSVKSGLWSGEPDEALATRTLVAKHLEVLREFNTGNSHGVSWAPQLKGKVDLTRLAYVGHSTGGGWVYGQWATGAVPNLKAAVALQPALGEIGTPAPKAPLLAITGKCDEQVGTFEPGAGLEAELQRAAKANQRVGILAAELAGTTHLGLVSGVAAGHMGSAGQGCDKASLLPNEKQQAQAAGLIGAFLEQALGGARDVKVPVGDGVRITTRALTPAMTIEQGRGELPAVVPAKSIRFTESPEHFIPKLDPKIVITSGEPL